MNYQNLWNELKDNLQETINNFTKLADEYSSKYEFTKARVTKRKCKEYKKFYDRMVALENLTDK